MEREACAHVDRALRANTLDGKSIALERGLPATAVAKELGRSVAEVERVFADITAKRAAASYSLRQRLMSLRR